MTSIQENVMDKEMEHEMEHEMETEFIVVDWDKGFQKIRIPFCFGSSHNTD